MYKLFVQYLVVKLACVNAALATLELAINENILALLEQNLLFPSSFNMLPKSSLCKHYLFYPG